MRPVDKRTKIGLGIGAAAGATILISWLASKTLESRIKAAQSPPSYRVQGPKVSIVIPSLEEENYLPQLLTTVANQTYYPIESVVADSSPDPSRKETEDICRHFGARYVYVPKLNVSLARNEGARFASGEILVFTDADCCFAPDYIEQAVAALESGYVLAHGADPTLGGGLWDTVTALARCGLKPSHWTSGRGIAIRRDTFWGLGGYNEALDPTLGYREDLDLGWRVAAAYGAERMKYFTTPMISESPRRLQMGIVNSWLSTRGVRNGKVIPV